MKRIVSFALCISLAVSTAGLCSCDDDSSSDAKSSIVATTPADNTDIGVTADEILVKLKETAEDMPVCLEMTEEDASFKNSYEKYLTMTSADKVADFAMMYSDAATADEIMVVKLIDTASAEELSAALADRVARRKKQFDGYDPDEMNRMDLAKIKQDGVYVLFVVCDNATDVVKAFDACLEK